MNIYDCFMYFDEDLLLDIRLNTLINMLKNLLLLRQLILIMEKKKTQF